MCSVDDGVDAGVTVATIDDTTWTSGVGTTWNVAGDGVQLNAPRTDDWMLTVVAQTDHDGNSVASAVSAEDFPIHVTLGTGDDGGFATLYPASGDSYTTTNGGAGELELLRMDQTVLIGCFSFTAGTDAGDEVSVDAGSIKARSAQ